ncbi:MAG: hypothetical protein M0Z28_14725 [Rhodospirillales bacterium]|nr:hypothetical protein [Rhodospirillales bacterium]
MSQDDAPGGMTCDIEADLCSLALNDAAAVLTFLGTQGERISVTMPPMMLETLGQQIAAMRSRLPGRWSPAGRTGRS